MNVLDLFSGIGGFSLGLERAGMRTVAFCEIDPYCRAVLRHHWPTVPVFDDVRTLTPETLADAAGAQLQATGEGDERARRSTVGPSVRCGVDLICGGFPCQDISVAGKAWVEFLMGYETGWTALDPSETPSSRKSSKS